MSAEEAITKLAGDLAFAKRASTTTTEAVVITDQATVREVLLEIERLKDRIQNPQFYAKSRA